MPTAHVEIPVERLADIEKYKDKLGELLLLGLTQMKIQESLYLYRRGLASFARAAELAGLPLEEMIGLGDVHKVHRRFFWRVPRAIGSAPME